MIATGKSDVLAQVCAALGKGDRSSASSIARANYPFAPRANSGRRYSNLEMTRVFVRDGFIDRYSGEKLVFPERSSCFLC